MRFLFFALSLMLFTTQAFPQGSPKKITQHDAMEAIAHKTAPDYPLIAKQLKIQGVVEVEAVIGEDGAVEHVKTVSGSPVLTKAAGDALLKWKFKPFTEDGKPIKVVATFSFTFNM
ncbi:MAG TPA: energy transducer TonB [Bryobacteraceae bacterium]|nr:energy transducer TonB [Bryobacteraceae bacterium]